MSNPTASSPALRSNFDIGPLTMIRAEIGHSLSEAKAGLDRIQVEPEDALAFKRALSQLHQVTGALSMVGLSAAAHVTHEMEKLVGSLSAGAEQAAKIGTLNLAMGVLTNYLDELTASKPDRPLKLAKCYIELNARRGAGDALASDLFFPDLTLPTPAPDPADLPPPSTVFVDAIRQARTIYQSGLLKLLREKDLVRGVREMRRATVAIEALKASSPSRSFWFAAIGFFDTVAIDPAGAGASAVQLFGKIDQQIKLLIDGPRDAPEKLFRDVLYIVGKSVARNEHIRHVREIYSLDNLLWVPEVAVGDPAKVAKLVATIREQIRSQKDTFLTLTNHNLAALEPFKKQAEALARLGDTLPNRDLAQLLKICGGVGKHLHKSQAFPNKTQGIEIATALLFIESSLQDYFSLTDQFSAQSANVVARLRSAMTGVDLESLDAPASQFADTMTLRAQTHLLIFQVGREVQINLTTIEGVLDDYFRDPAKALELTLIAPLLKQIEGALTMLDLDEAAALSKAVSKHIIAISTSAANAANATGDTEGEAASNKNVGASTDAISAVEGLTALGLYIGALQQGAADPRATLLPTLIQFGIAEKTVAVQKTRPKHIERIERTPEKIVTAMPISLPTSTTATATAPAPAMPSMTRPQPVLHQPTSVIAATPSALALTSTQTNSATAAPVDLPTAMRAIQQLTAAQAELKKLIQERDKRINALELVLASLSHKLKNAEDKAVPVLKEIR